MTEIIGDPERDDTMNQSPAPPLPQGDDPSIGPWKKAEKSIPTGACVELAPIIDPSAAAKFGGEIAIRDSKYPEGPVRVISSRVLAAFVDWAKYSDEAATLVTEEPNPTGTEQA